MKKIKVFPHWAWIPYHYFRERLTRPELVYLETHLTDHCNLNCKGCGHFSCISCEWFSDKKQFQKDLRQLQKLFSKVHKIRLMGGEPLLHPELKEFLTITREEMPHSDIRLVTNGILLPRMDNSFWSACKDNNITIDVTIYPPYQNREDEWIQLSKQKKVSLVIKKTECFHAHMNLRGDTNPKESFLLCRKIAACPFLRDGHVYVCAIPSLANYFNSRFDMHIDTSGEINLYQPGLTGWNVLALLKKPVEACRFCANEIRSFAWSVSDQCVQEWDVSTYNQLSLNGD